MEYTSKDGWKVYLGDDGTMDTVLLVVSPAGREYTDRFSDVDRSDPSWFAELAESAIDFAAEGEV